MPYSDLFIGESLGYLGGGGLNCLPLRLRHHDLYPKQALSLSLVGRRQSFVKSYGERTRLLPGASQQALRMTFFFLFLASRRCGQAH